MCLPLGGSYFAQLVTIEGTPSWVSDLQPEALGTHWSACSAAVSRGTFLVTRCWRRDWGVCGFSQWLVHVPADALARVAVPFEYGCSCETPQREMSLETEAQTVQRLAPVSTLRRPRFPASFSSARPRVFRQVERPRSQRVGWCNGTTTAKCPVNMDRKLDLASRHPAVLLL